MTAYKFGVGVASCLLGFNAGAQGTTIVTIEAAGVQETSQKLAYSATETFDKLEPTNYDTLETKFGDGKVAGFYDRASVRKAGPYGGAGGEGNYDVIDKSATLTLKGAMTDYFGFWASAINGGETLVFFRKGEAVDKVALSSLKFSDEYYGNPTKPYNGADPKEVFAFINFHVLGGFDAVSFLQGEGGRFETDNHTVGIFGDSAEVPEPAVWLTMMFGFGLVGTGLRRRSTAALS